MGGWAFDTDVVQKGPGRLRNVVLEDFADDSEKLSHRVGCILR
jgi:hypothetical protein